MVAAEAGSGDGVFRFPQRSYSGCPADVVSERDRWGTLWNINPAMAAGSARVRKNGFSLRDEPLQGRFHSVQKGQPLVLVDGVVEQILRLAHVLHEGP